MVCVVLGSPPRPVVRHEYSTFSKQPLNNWFHRKPYNNKKKPPLQTDRTLPNSLIWPPLPSLRTFPSRYSSIATWPPQGPLPHLLGRLDAPSPPRGRLDTPYLNSTPKRGLRPLSVDMMLADDGCNDLRIQPCQNFLLKPC